MKEKRPNIPEKVKLNIWTVSGGRCQFRGCNKPLWTDDLTLADGKFGEIAHIIGVNGPRSNELSETLAQDANNLMLLCRTHHRLIDNEEKEKYSVEVLKKMKDEHETRVETLLDIHREECKTTVVCCLINIGDRIPKINKNEIANAIYPFYPTDNKGIEYVRTDFEMKSEPTVWENTAKAIQNSVKEGLKGGYNSDPPKRLSVFGIGPMPFLMYLGKCIGSILTVTVHQKFRNKESPNTWRWSNEDTEMPLLKYYSNKISKGNGNSVALLIISVSDFIEPDKYKNMLDKNVGCSVWEISVDNPTPQDIVKTKEDVKSFLEKYRSTLNEIQKDCGVDVHIYILPAIPVSLAVECGRAILPTKDPAITVCQYYPDTGFKPVLKIN